MGLLLTAVTAYNRLLADGHNRRYRPEAGTAARMATSATVPASISFESTCSASNPFKAKALRSLLRGRYVQARAPRAPLSRGRQRAAARHLFGISRAMS